LKNITDTGPSSTSAASTGLLHVTDISWGRIGHPSEIFQIGDQVEVVVLHFDSVTGRVSLGTSRNPPTPWADVDQRYPWQQGVGPHREPDELRAFVELEARRCVSTSHVDDSDGSPEPGAHLAVVHDISRYVDPSFHTAHLSSTKAP